MPAQYYSPPVVVMTPEQLTETIRDAFLQGAETLRQELRRRPDACEPRIIAGRPAILKFFGLSPKNYEGLRARMAAYPEAFTREGRNSIFLNVAVFEELKQREGKMRRR